MTTTLSESQAKRRFRRRSRNRPYVGTDLGRTVCEQVLPALANWMFTPAAPPYPEWLSPFTDLLAHEEWALVALAPLLDQIDRGWKRDDRSARMKICLTIGKALRDKLEMRLLQKRDPDAYDRVMSAYAPKYPGYRPYNKHVAINRHRQLTWKDPECVDAGNWLLDCATALDFFDLDEEGFPKIGDRHQAAVDRLREELIERDPVHLPLLEPPQPWTDWDAGGGPTAGTFVRDSHPATEKAIREAFARRRGNDALHALWGADQQWPPFLHVDGVNHLQAVPWRINEPMIKVVRRFAGEVPPRDDTWGGVGKRVSRNQVWRDLATAKYLAGKPFWVDMNCDFRGRLYGVPHFNFLREDHCRSLFLFDQGMPIGDDGFFWLMVHIANCFDEPDGDMTIGKRAWDIRADWTRRNRDMIVRTARNPEDTVDWWRCADAPFSFVAACKEWVEADGDRGYVTRLPIPLDATCNGVQQLAALARDEHTGLLTNLVPASVPADAARARAVEGLQDKFRAQFQSDDEGKRFLAPHASVGAIAEVARALDDIGRYRRTESEPPRDVYRDILNRVVGRLEAEHNETSSARFWLVENRLTRKIVKRPASTFGYSVTADGMRKQIVGAYMRQHENHVPKDIAAWYLAHRIMAVCKEVLKKPAEVMDFIRALAEHLADHNLPLRWVTPTGFPVINGYYPSNVKIVDLELRGARVRYKVADGWGCRVDIEKSLNAAAPNYIHSLDASHAVRAINAAAREGITNVATVHDCFASLAPQVQRLHQLVRREFYWLHAPDLLVGLRDAATRDFWDRSETPWFGERTAIGIFPMLRYGSLDLAQAQQSEYMTS